jgi:transcriptional regulator with XRE-family HTH domain
MTKKILPEVAARLKTIRQQIGCDKKAMAARLGITTSGYYKNEHGETLPSVNSLKRLSDDFNISMDWLFFNKGPMHYEEKTKKEMELNQERQDLLAECQKRDEELSKLQEKTGFIESRPEMQELLEYIEEVPIFYHKLMVFFQEYKMKSPSPQ